MIITANDFIYIIIVFVITYAILINIERYKKQKTYIRIKTINERLKEKRIVLFEKTKIEEIELVHIKHGDGGDAGPK